MPTAIPADQATIRDLTRQAQRSDVIVTERGRPVAVVLSPERYEHYLELVETEHSATRAAAVQNGRS